jgi:hypothetical protein
MAQIPNQTYPQSAGEYDATTKFYAYATSKSGSSFVGTGVYTIAGFTAEGAIAQFQPVIASTVPGTGFKVSGSTGRAQTAILGVAESAATNGSNVNVIVKGVVPMIMSGSIGIGVGVGASSSGSTWAIEDTATLGADLYISGSNRVIFGYAIGTGSRATTALVFLV